MRKAGLIAGVVGLVGMSGIAVADGYRQPVGYAPAYSYNWSGVYFGSHIGGGWADVNLSESLFVAPVVAPATQSFTASGWIGGVHLGAMKQFGSLVTGVELNMDDANINGSANNCAGVPTVVCRSQVNWLSTGLSRLGVAWDNWLVYGTVGYAIAGVDHSVSAPVGGATIRFDKSDVPHGIALGGGLEFAVSKDLMLGVQYLHTNLEARDTGLLFGGVITNGKRDLDLDIVTARLSYKFGGECCARVPLK
jgi:outer membrane immunogenic protein